MFWVGWGLDTNHVFYAGAVVGLCAFVPYIAQLTAIATSQLNRMHELRSLEPSGANEQVIIRFHNIRLAILTNNTDTVRSNPMNRPSLKSHIRQSKSRIIIIRNNNPLTTRIILRRQLLPQIRAISKLSLHHLFALPSELVGKRV
jgi:hypothetical protein